MREKTVVMDDWKDALSAFLAGKRWHKHQCEGCGAIFFSKQPNASLCGWRKCGDWDASRAMLPRRKKSVSPKQVQDTLSQQLAALGYKIAQPRNIANALGDTDFVVAGVQMFDEVIHEGVPVLTGKYFVGQPAVRMQFQERVAKREGFSTSFVNTCTEVLGITFEEHLQTLDHWFRALSKIGLHMHDTTLMVRVSDDDWGTGTFPALEIFFSYAGLEIGDATYALVPRTGQEPVSISDIGFGLERLVWAINRNASYFDLLLPWRYDGGRELADLCRTAMLLSSCGVTPANKGAGFQLRKLAKMLGSKYRATDWQSFLAYYFAYWAQFIAPSVSEGDAIRVVHVEADRELNGLIHKRLWILPPRVETTEEYADRLVYTSPIDIRTLRDTIHLCRNT